MADVVLLVIAAAIVIVSAAGSVFWLRSLRGAQRQRQKLEARLRRQLAQQEPAVIRKVLSEVDAAATIEELDDIRRRYGTPD